MKLERVSEIIEEYRRGTLSPVSLYARLIPIMRLAGVVPIEEPKLIVVTDYEIIVHYGTYKVKLYDVDDKTVTVVVNIGEDRIILDVKLCTSSKSSH